MRLIRRPTIQFLITAMLCLGFLSCEGKSGTEKGVTMYANAQSGLLIRSEATTNSAKLALIPHGAEVTVFEQVGELTTISGREGYWRRVQYAAFEGWVFGGFLSTNPPEVPEPKHKCADFMKCYNECSDLLAGPGYEMCMDDCDSNWTEFQAACEPKPDSN